MAAHGKNYRKALDSIGDNKKMPIDQAITKLKEISYTKFDGSIRVDLTLGIDPSKTEQSVRGSVSYPHGLGKKLRVVVFAKGEHADQALRAGADYVGVEDIIEKIKGGWLDFEVAVATPDLMGAVGQLAKILGPRGLLPNKKVGTVTFDVADVVKDLKGGKTFFKNDRGGLVHLPIGKVSFDTQKLHDNFAALMKAVVSTRPASSKGRFIKKTTISSTMSPGIEVDVDSAFKL